VVHARSSSSLVSTCHDARRDRGEWIEPQAETFFLFAVQERTAQLLDPIRESANYIFGKRSARLLNLFTTDRLPSKSGCAAYRRLQRRLLRPDVNNVTAATSSATPSPPPPPDWYVRHISICLAMDVLPFALLLVMLFNASIMFEFHMSVVDVVLFNMLELIMEIVSNYPTSQKPNCMQFSELTMAGFADALRLDKFTGMHFKRWQIKATL
jgi:hypothetical protein